MRSVLLGAMVALVPSSAMAGSFFCNDACTIDPASGDSCSSLGMGCNPILHVCVPVCDNDSHCQPGGSCMDGECTGVVCAPAADAGSDAGPADDAGMNGDAGPANDAAMNEDAGDATTPDTGDDADAGNDAGDGPADAASTDALDPTMLLGGGRGSSLPRAERAGDGCGCTSTASRGGSAWTALVLLLLFRLRNSGCRRTR